MALERLGVDDRALADAIGNAYMARREQSYRIFPHSHRTLRALADAGVVLGLVTNGESHKQRAKLVRFDLERYFHCTVIEGEFGVGKPDPAVFNHALERLGMQPSEVWMVGDNLEWDVAAPMSLGITGIWNDHRNKGIPAGVTTIPDRIIRHVGELIIETRL
jgi:putative hydrolase of the HAD superfamily